MSETTGTLECWNVGMLEREPEGSKIPRFQHSEGLAYLAPIGTRLAFTATVLSIHGDYGPFGIKWKVVMDASAGHRLVWHSSSPVAALAYRGTVLTLVGTVKEHRTSAKGRAITVLTNCKQTGTQ